MPLARALSKLGVLSRRQAIAAVLEGRVRVGGEVVREPGRLVSPERDDLRVDEAPARRQATRVIALHKPRGYVTTRVDPQGRPTVYDLLPADAVAAGVQAVGRLDLATSGLLLFTNDTRLAAWLTDPATGVLRTYLVTVRGELADATVARLLAEGVVDQGETLRPREVAVRKRSRRETHLTVVLDEGRNREIRRMFAATGHEVTALKRVAFGPIELGDLPPGATRELEVGIFRFEPAPQP
ncbi:pseudouridine synthase [Luteitalea sp. TBR-22]|uniref:pseudouridine synthase n=1 Tax=Luteitalea sp. TBR-22 TaxID=2802971 RepID=UPI001AF0D784|nr:pseudouridine synthase [Luteitalea sp. TBR-22]BCS35850.1 pseudouridine synthase [Luteitalea sp. TBR-22]